MLHLVPIRGRGSTLFLRFVAKTSTALVCIIFYSLQEEKCELEKEVEIIKLNQDESVRLKAEISSLQNKLADLQKESHREIAKQKGKVRKKVI